MSSTRRQIGLSLCSALGLGLLFTGPATAQLDADLSISPKRIVVAPSGHVGAIFLLNRGSQKTTYVISLVDRVMGEDGRIEAIEDVKDNPQSAEAVGRVRSAREMVVFTPRRVTLGPGETQTIRIRVERPAGLADGEYRTHLTITATPPAEDGFTAEDATRGQIGGIRLQVRALFSTAIPVIVRQGAVQADAEVRDVEYRPQGLAGAPVTPGGVLSVKLVRKGPSSLYGDVIVRRVGAGRLEAPLGQIRGIAVYPEIGRRAVQIPLSRPIAKGEQVEVVYTDDDTKAGQRLGAAVFTPT